MNKKLPYEEELSKQLNDLSLPDENVSWEDMKRRLDDDSDDGAIIPPPQNGCFGYSVLLILLALGAWLIVRPDKWLWSSHEKNIVSSEKVPNKKNSENFIENEKKDSQKNSNQSGSEKGIDSVVHNNKKYLTEDLLKPNNKKESKQKNI